MTVEDLISVCCAIPEWGQIEVHYLYSEWEVFSRPDPSERTTQRLAVGKTFASVAKATVERAIEKLEVARARETRIVESYHSTILKVEGEMSSQMQILDRTVARIEAAKKLVAA